MRVSIIVSGWFKRYTGGSSHLEIEVNEGETAYNAVCAAGIPASEIGFVSVEGIEKAGTDKRVDENYVVSEGSVLRVYPLIIGG